MTVAQLIKRLQKMDPKAVVTKFHPGEGYDEAMFVEGTMVGQTTPALRVNHVAESEGKAEYLWHPGKPSRAKAIPFVVIY